MNDNRQQDKQTMQRVAEKVLTQADGKQAAADVIGAVIAERQRRVEILRDEWWKCFKAPTKNAERMAELKKALRDLGEDI